MLIPCEHPDARGPAPKPQQVSLADILIVWHAGFPERTRTADTPFSDLAAQIVHRFPFSWRTAVDTSMRLRAQERDPLRGSGGYDVTGQALRELLIANGVWHAHEVPVVA